MEDTIHNEEAVLTRLPCCETGRKPVPFSVWPGGVNWLVSIDTPVGWATADYGVMHYQGNVNTHTGQLTLQLNTKYPLLSQRRSWKFCCLLATLTLFHSNLYPYNIIACVH